MQVAAMRDKRFLVFAAIAAVLLLGLIAEVLILHGRTASLQTAQAQARAKSAELRKELTGANRDEWQARNAELQSVLSQIDPEVPRQDFVEQLWGQVSQSAADTGNVVEELRPGESKAGYVVSAAGEGAQGAEGGQSYDTVDVDARLDGTFPGAFDFLKRLGAVGKIISVEEITITRRDERRPDDLVKADVRLRMRTYILEPRPRFPGDLTITTY